MASYDVAFNNYQALPPLPPSPAFAPTPPINTMSMPWRSMPTHATARIHSQLMTTPVCAAAQGLTLVHFSAQ